MAFSRTQLPETPVTGTVVDLLLSRFVIFSLVPTGNTLLITEGAAESEKKVSATAPQAFGLAAAAFVSMLLTVLTRSGSPLKAPEVTT